MSKYKELVYKEEGSKKIKIKNKKISYLSKKEIKGHEKDIIGYATLSTNHIPKNTFAVIDGLLNDTVYISRKKHGFVRGYVKTETGEIIGIYKYRYPFILTIGVAIVTLLTIITLLVVSATLHKPIKDLLPVDPGEIFENLGGDGQKDLEQILKDDPGIDFPIYSLKEFIIDDNHPTINLGNPDTNVVLFQYIIKNQDDEIIYKTNLIEPGKAIAWPVKQNLKAGTYDLKIETKTYTPKSQTETNGFATKLKVIIK